MLSLSLFVSLFVCFLRFCLSVSVSPSLFFVLFLFLTTTTRVCSTPEQIGWQGSCEDPTQPPAVMQCNGGTVMAGWAVGNIFVVFVLFNLVLVSFHCFVVLVRWRRVQLPREHRLPYGHRTVRAHADTLQQPAAGVLFRSLSLSSIRCFFVCSLVLVPVCLCFYVSVSL